MHAVSVVVDALLNFGATVCKRYVDMAVQMYDWNGAKHSLFSTRSVIVEWAEHLLQTKAGSAENLLRNFASEWDNRVTAGCNQNKAMIFIKKQMTTGYADTLWETYQGGNVMLLERQHLYTGMEIMVHIPRDNEGQVVTCAAAYPPPLAVNISPVMWQPAIISTIGMGESGTLPPPPVATLLTHPFFLDAFRGEAITNGRNHGDDENFSEGTSNTTACIVWLIAEQRFICVNSGFLSFPKTLSIFEVETRRETERLEAQAMQAQIHAPAPAPASAPPPGWPQHGTTPVATTNTDPATAPLAASADDRTLEVIERVMAMVVQMVNQSTYVASDDTARVIDTTRLNIERLSESYVLTNTRDTIATKAVNMTLSELGLNEPPAAVVPTVTPGDPYEPFCNRPPLQPH